MTGWLPSSLPLEFWPEADQEAWASAIGGDPLALEGGGGGAAWRPSTRSLVENGYGRWLSWLEHTGALDSSAAPGARATVPQVRQYLDALEAAGLADHSRAGRLQALSDALRVMQPEADVNFISRAAQRISSTAKRARDLRPRLRPPQDVLAFGRELILNSRSEAALSPVEQAILFRDGLIIALWSLRALRIANLANIEISRNLVRGTSGHRLQFEPEEMKAGRPFSCTWPNCLEDALESYLQKLRPVLRAIDRSGSSDQGLWISQFGRRMKPASVGQMLRIQTERGFGEAINPHLMRHMVATAVAEDRPNDIADVPAMLGHADLETSEKHYILAGSVRAATSYQAVLSGRQAPRLRRGS